MKEQTDRDQGNQFHQGGDN
uniref:Uncharacterized protein n=1 Tax=Anguilla anguilla TaxID=7936 RepID=A0A0E9U532_ANGAN